MPVRLCLILVPSLLLIGCGGSNRSTEAQGDQEPTVVEASDSTDNAEAGSGEAATEAEANPETATPKAVVQAREDYRRQAMEALAAAADSSDQNSLSDGAHKRDYPDGRKVSYNVANGKLNGAYKSFYADGAAEIEANYKDGLKDGSYKSFYANGERNEEGTYRVGKKHGTWSSWHPNGQEMEKAEFAEGKIVKIYAAYLADGTQIVDAENPRQVD